MERRGTVRRYNQQKKYPHTKKRLVFRLVATFYLVFLILSQAASPTTAYFTETTTIEGSITAAAVFDEEVPESEDVSDEIKEEANETNPSEAKEDEAPDDSEQEQTTDTEENTD